MVAIPEERHPERVRAMFGEIARTYDLLNRALSLGLDARWRRRAAAEACREPAARVLDVCGGSGDLAIALARTGRAEWVVCCDFALPMLDRARRKFRRRGAIRRRCVPIAADALHLPFLEASFDALTVAFGVRNLADPAAGFREMHRVLRPGGRLVVLEFSTPTGRVIGPAYRLYLGRILPRIGDRVSGRCGPYRYLASTIASFPDPPTLAGTIREAGFAAVGWIPLTGGVVCIHTALKGCGTPALAGRQPVTPLP